VKLDLALRELHRSENSLAADLLTVADRHRVDHEIYHVARDLARWSQQHVHEITEIGQRYGLDLKDEAPEDSGLLATVRGKLSELTGRRPEPSLLLADLRHLHRTAAGVSLDGELLGQGAQAVKDSELLALTKRCHPQSLRQMRWANAMLKVLSPQILSAVRYRWVAPSCLHQRGAVHDLVQMCHEPAVVMVCKGLRWSFLLGWSRVSAR
jgi:hypothetical protein